MTVSVIPPSQRRLYELGTVRLDRDFGLRFGRPGDRDAIDRGFERLSERSRYLRFFSPIRQLTPAILDNLASVDQTDRVAVVACPIDAPDELVGVVRYFRNPDVPNEADVALTVLDDYQGLGLASAMYDVCADVAAMRGISVFSADVLAENTAMIEFFRKRDAKIKRDPHDASVLQVRLPL